MQSEKSDSQEQEAGMIKNYMLISTALLILSMLQFMIIFEKRKPKAREIVLLATVSAITSAANLISAFTVPVHAGTAFVIIAGIAMGPEAGFLVGALSRFVCNFFTGQGPWTVWEMAAWGILGFLAGYAFNRVKTGREIFEEKKSRDFKAVMGPVICVIVAEILAYLIYILSHSAEEAFLGWRVYVFGFVGMLAGFLLQRKKLPADDLTISLFTFFSVFIIYGGIMNFAALIMTNPAGTGDIRAWLNALKLLYITGLPYDAIHALGAAVCAYLFGYPVIKKIERIKIKYGMYR